jgi:hypothetical protein
VKLIGSCCAYGLPLVLSFISRESVPLTIWNASGLLFSLFGVAFYHIWDALRRPWALFDSLWATLGYLVGPFQICFLVGPPNVALFLFVKLSAAESQDWKASQVSSRTRAGGQDDMNYNWNFPK